MRVQHSEPTNGCEFLYASLVPKNETQSRPIKRAPRTAATIKANVEALLRYAAEHPELHDRRKPEALAEYIRAQNWGDTVSRSSIYNMLEGRHATGSDALDLVARAFDLEAWHLLTPNLDPANPPVILASQIEKDLWRDLQEGARRFAAIGRAESGQQQHPDERAPRLDRDTASDAPSETNVRPSGGRRRKPRRRVKST